MSEPVSNADELDRLRAENADLKERIDKAWGDNAANEKITDRLRADLVAAQGYRSAAEEIARRAGEINQSLIAENASLKAAREVPTSSTRCMVRLDGVWITPDAALDEIHRLRAELAALKANDPLAEMWRELAEYQPQAYANGHGMCWMRMCEYRTREAAATAANPSVTPSAAARAAARAAAGAAAHFGEAMKSAADAVVIIRRAKEAKP